MSEIRSVIINRLKEKHMKNIDLAKKIGYSTAYIGDLLNGKRRFNEEVLEKVFTALDLQLELKVNEESEGSQ